jgi:hypothetical protein
VDLVPELEFPSADAVLENYEKGQVAGTIVKLDEEKRRAGVDLLQRRAVLRLTSGHTVGPRQGVRRRPLPWMIEFPDAPGVKLDPWKYGRVWEFGRAAQIESGLNETSMAIAAVVAYRELFATGGDLDRAYIFAHAPKKRNADLYRRWGYVHYCFPQAGAEDEILAIPLRTMLENPKTWKKFAAADWMSKFVTDGQMDFARALYAFDLLVSERTWTVRARLRRRNHLSFGLYDFTRSRGQFFADWRKEIAAELTDADADVLFERSRSVAQAHADTDLGWWRRRLGAKEKPGEPADSFEIVGLEKAAKGKGAEHAVLTILSATWDFLQRQQGVRDPSQYFLATQGTDLEPLTKILREFGIPFESHRWEKDGKVFGAVVMDLEEFIAENPQLLEFVEYEGRKSARGKIYESPLNF